MKRVIVSLEALSSALEKNQDAAQSRQMISALKVLVRESKSTAAEEAVSLLNQLEAELDTWLLKLDAILKEDAGRKGMAKHARNWIDELKKLKL